MKTYDTIVIGAGHNGLVAAAYLAKAGQSVLVLERRDVLGGQVVTETFAEGFSAGSLHPGGALHPTVVKELRLDTHGLPPTAPQPAFTALFGGSDQLELSPDPQQAMISIRRFSQKDASIWPEFLTFMAKASRFINRADATIMPRLSFSRSSIGDNPGEGLGLAGLGVNLRNLGGADMMKIVRGLPMTAEEFVDEWFESGALKAAIASLGIHGATLGVMGAGTGYVLMRNWARRGGLAHAPVAGGVGKISDALAQALRTYGGEIRTGAGVARIRVESGVCNGVVLASGEEIAARRVLSALDPRQTFMKLVGVEHLSPDFVWKVGTIKMRGSTARLHLLTDGTHGIPSGTLALAPSIKYLERAYDAAKYHQVSNSPYLEITSAEDVVSIHFQYAPYHLKSGDWISQPPRLEQITLENLAPIFPHLQSSIRAFKLLTPKDIEDVYGLSEGDLNHGQLMLDQFFFMRPLPGWSNHRTPIQGLYLAGNGVHGGGGISGAAGRNAARVAGADSTKGRNQGVP